MQLFPTISAEVKKRGHHAAAVWSYRTATHLTIYLSRTVIYTDLGQCTRHFRNNLPDNVHLVLIHLPLPRAVQLLHHVYDF